MEYSVIEGMFNAVGIERFRLTKLVGVPLRFRVVFVVRVSWDEIRNLVSWVG